MAAAIKDYDFLVDLHPDDPNAYYFRGQTRLKMNQQAAACADWKRAEDLGNRNATEMLQRYCH